MTWLARPAGESACRENEMRVAYDNPLAPQLIGSHLRRLLDTPSPRRTASAHYSLPREAEAVILCIGTDRSTGDALGPLVGQRLSEAGFTGLVFGTLDNPVHASNLTQTMELLEQEHPGRPIVAVDACLGQAGNVGTITLGPGALRPGAGVNKNLPPVGDVFITGTVNVGGIMEYLVLQNTRLSLVMRMACAIAEGLILAAREGPAKRSEPAGGGIAAAAGLPRPHGPT